MQKKCKNKELGRLVNDKYTQHIYAIYKIQSTSKTFTVVFVTITNIVKPTPNQEPLNVSS